MLTSRTFHDRGFAELAIVLLVLGFMGGMLATNSLLSAMQNRTSLKRINYGEGSFTSELAAWQNFSSGGKTSQAQIKDSAGRYLFSFPNDYTADLPTLGSDSPRLLKDRSLLVFWTSRRLYKFGSDGP